MTIYVGGVGLLLALLTGILITEGDLQITLTTGNIFLADNNKGCDVEPHAAYVGFEVCNTSGANLQDLTVSLGNFSNPAFGLAGNQDAVQSIENLEIGECITLFWYTYYDCSRTDATSDMTITVADQQGDLVSQTETVGTTNTIDAGAGGKVLTSRLVSDTVLGVVLGYGCEYSFGSLASDSPILFQPTGNLDFNAGCFQLVGSEVVYSDISDVQVGDKNQLFYGSVSKHSGSGHVIQVQYYFRNDCIDKDTTVMRGYSGAISGKNFKRYNVGDAGMINDNILPISWKWAKVEWSGKNGLLTWGASGVLEGESYTIERSENGRQFQVLDQFPAENLRTGSDEYAYEDLQAEELRTDQIFYRLKHVDLNGITSYSEIQELSVSSRELTVELFPNPSRDFINIRYNNLKQEAGSLRILNLNGQELYSSQFGAQEQFQQKIDLQQWPEGKYFLEILCGDQLAVEGFIKE